MNGDNAEAQAAVMALAIERGVDKTFCPSEVARILTQDDGGWRDMMPQVHDAVRSLSRQNRVRLTWKGAPRAVDDGPYRVTINRDDVS